MIVLRLISTKKICIFFNCQKCNVSVCLDEASDIAYLTRLAREEPGLYAKLASRDGGLQGYIEAMGEFNELPSTISKALFRLEYFII